MILVVEGPSATGKSTWATAHGSDNVIDETGRIDGPVGFSADRLAGFWAEVNCRRWTEAIDVEMKSGIALCDTDPLKLHYDYCLARIGVESWDDFDLGVAAATNAITQQRLGLADVVLVSFPDDQTLERQRNSDLTRRRRNFQLHRRLGPSLRDWYATLDQLDPGRVQWRFPPMLPAPVVRERHDVDMFREWMSQLPRHTAGG